MSAGGWCDDTSGRTWERLLAYAQTRRHAAGELEWIVSVDATVNGRISMPQGPDGGLPRPSCWQRGEAAQNAALGRSRGGLTTKLHLACDGRGQPLSIVVTEGH